ncbi:hypothetical protein DFH08DRAFT_1074412 [Mycena albidolilacea]|uniref:F-box domain-containing protein n=1 Tax=Mycena albidolilacea TaxID=1033008 RepID=A0AAD7AKQ6_9AGAR|nr:hypothetical protein DFH08DRAFT_1074412 [Mycena albidolilacea]
MRLQSWSPGTQIPPELVAEIVGHNADDIPSLRAMSLVSKALRSFAIEHLFSLFILHARKISPGGAPWVKFSDPTPGWMERRRAQVLSPTPLHQAVIPPEIPILPNVSVVEWESNTSEIDNATVIAYMALFPNTQELYLSGMSFYGISDMSFVGFDELATILRACGKLRVLSFSATEVDDTILPEINRGRPTFNLTALEDLRVAGCDGSELEEFDFLSQLVEASRPTELKSLTFAYNEGQWANSMGKLLRLASPCLVNLTLLLDTYVLDEEIIEVIEMLNRLPAFPALDTLSLVLSDQSTKQLLNALPAAPKLTTLNFRIMLDSGAGNDFDREDFRGLISKAFPWGGSESMRIVLTQKFPLLHRIGFYICVPRNSAMHFRRGLRRRMERELKNRLEETGADLAGYLEVGWLDEKFNSVVYSKTNGKPPWKLPPGYRYRMMGSESQSICKLLAQTVVTADTRIRCRC